MVLKSPTRTVANNKRCCSRICQQAMRCCCQLSKCLLVAVILLVIVAMAKSKAHGDYLYHIEEAEGVIIDYDDTSNLQPDFLYAPDQGPRVVEFYAPWCPHCQHFKQHYIEFAEQMSAVVKEFDGPEIQFYAVSCTAHHRICRDMGIKGYPKIQLFGQGAHHNMTAEVKYWKLHPFDVLTGLGIQADRVKLLPVVQANEKKDATQLRKERVKLEFARSKQEMFDDAHLSFDFNMRTGIFTSEGPLTNTTKLVLEEWLELLKKTTPATWQLQPVIKEILDNFDWATEKEENLISLMDKHPGPPRKTWSSSCTKGAKGMGFTCGLWILFHMMSIGVVEYNSMIGFTDDGLLGDLSVTTVQAAETLRNFIEHFFQCDYCRVNFLQSYDSCDHDRCNRLSDKAHSFEQWIQLPVWLFETHNSVNARLVREKAERENAKLEEEEVELSQWPAKENCPVCWADHGAWNETNVYKFLRTEYWSEDAVTAEHRELLQPYRKTMLDKPPRFPFEIFPIGCATAVFLYWYTKRSKLIESGKHKKYDNDKC